MKKFGEGMVGRYPVDSQNEEMILKMRKWIAIFNLCLYGPGVFLYFISNKLNRNCFRFFLWHANCDSINWWDGGGRKLKPIGFGLLE